MSPELVADIVVDRGSPALNLSTTDNHKLMLPGKYNSADYGRILYLKFDISGIKGISSGADLQLYVRQPVRDSLKTVKYLSIYEIDDTFDFDENTLTYGNLPENGKFGKRIATKLINPPTYSTFYKYNFDISGYLKKKVEAGNEYIILGVGIDEELQKQLYPNGNTTVESNFNVQIRTNDNSNKAKIILY